MAFTIGVNGKTYGVGASAALGGGSLIGFTAGRSVNAAAGAAEKIAGEPFVPNA